MLRHSYRERGTLILKAMTVLRQSRDYCVVVEICIQHQQMFGAAGVAMCS
jgi:hypothetical protein